MYIRKAAISVAIVMAIVTVMGSTFASASTAVLRKESRGNEVVSLQKNLIKLGYLSTNATGYFGSATERAVKNLQKKYGYYVDGIVGKNTFSLLDRLLGKNTSRSTTTSSKLLKRGDENSSVKALQQDLISFGFLNTNATGFFGPATEAAVKKLQQKHGCAVDGIAGSATFAVINSLKSGASESAPSRASTASPTLMKDGDENEHVKALQQDLISLGYLSTNATGYFGPATKAAVISLQLKYGCAVDGIAGNATLALISKLKSGEDVPVASKDQSEYMLPWYSNVAKVFARGDTAIVYDIKTGKSFNIKRTYGTNHADCETLTSKDTAIMKGIYNGKWSWERRAIIVSVRGLNIAACMTGLPHAGSDKHTANAVVSSRSGGYGRGTNLDAVKGNNMDGVFDIHFYGSKNHYNNKIDPKHQALVKTAAEWAAKNYK